MNRNSEAIAEGAIHLMQVLPGMGEHYSPAEVDLAVANVLTHYQRRLRRDLWERVDALRSDDPDPTRAGFVNGWDSALTNVLDLLNGEDL
jgi:hypothetical protein